MPTWLIALLGLGAAYLILARAASAALTSAANAPVDLSKLPASKPVYAIGSVVHTTEDYTFGSTTYPKGTTGLVASSDQWTTAIRTTSPESGHLWIVPNEYVAQGAS